MANRLKGKDAADALSAELKVRGERLREKGIEPTLAIVRVGEKPEDLSYERGALARAEKTGVRVQVHHFEENISQRELVEELGKLNKDDRVHGVLLFRPLPEHMDEEHVCRALDPKKDIDGITEGSLAGIFMETKRGFPPCTARACMEILDYYNIPTAGKKAAVLGRSLVIGKPAAMMMMGRNATVTVCHSKTGEENMKEICRGADIIIAAMGRAKCIDGEYLSEGQTVLDVGINTDEEGKLCGDVDFEQAEKAAANITPVPGGIGAVTTAVLMLHTMEAAEKAAEAEAGKE